MMLAGSICEWCGKRVSKGAMGGPGWAKPSHKAGHKAGRSIQKVTCQPTDQAISLVCEHCKVTGQRTRANVSFSKRDIHVADS